MARRHEFVIAELRHDETVSPLPVWSEPFSTEEKKHKKVWPSSGCSVRSYTPLTQTWRWDQLSLHRKRLAPSPSVRFPKRVRLSHTGCKNYRHTWTFFLQVRWRSQISCCDPTFSRYRLHWKDAMQERIQAPSVCPYRAPSYWILVVPKYKETSCRKLSADTPGTFLDRESRTFLMHPLTARHTWSRGKEYYMPFTLTEKAFRKPPGSYCKNYVTGSEVWAKRCRLGRLLPAQVTSAAKIVRPANVSSVYRDDSPEEKLVLLGLAAKKDTKREILAIPYSLLLTLKLLNVEPLDGVVFQPFGVTSVKVILFITSRDLMA